MPRMERDRNRRARVSSTVGTLANRHGQRERYAAWLGRSGHFASGKLWTVSKMRLVRTLDEGFVADDPEYEPNDSAIARMHCRV